MTKPGLIKYITLTLTRIKTQTLTLTLTQTQTLTLLCVRIINVSTSVWRMELTVDLTKQNLAGTADSLTDARGVVREGGSVVLMFPIECANYL